MSQLKSVFKINTYLYSRVYCQRIIPTGFAAAIVEEDFTEILPQPISKMSAGGGGGGGPPGGPYPNGSRSHLQAFLNNSLAIRQEIQRFESVHPSIYAIYDLIEMIPDQQVAQQIRDHVVCIEGERGLLIVYILKNDIFLYPIF